MMPHIWCPGCGHGIILGAILRAISKAGLDQDKTVIVSGIGCSSRASGYMDFDTLHTTHGRALAFATGVKMAKPELNVIVIMGDGDCSAIGGNHFIHACRRNIDLTAVVFNNSIYGMTSGQYSPLTPRGKFATTAPYGTIEREFDLCDLAIAAGASYVGRGTTFHAQLLTDLIVKGIANKGFSLIEGISQCPTYYGRKNKMGGPIDMMKWQQEHSVNAVAATKMTPEQLDGKFKIGELHNSPAPEYIAEYDKIIAARRA
ncbi:MAG TPA: 2-oxoglutarate ferredoxin oxidoreductase subunit beta [Firmicutes bacterium]|nr:2-oxoglutarate ferredoxin oxidoreductase subunit beta [Bacillota bacterium]HAW70296.1 2-oxoglutarate ferredoxin oxidoreductase subunit beta [Bacillota bacterium]HAZ21229.1 2-oxoglutarate ferredoxin oxidoreductase subunit beta [Bacillota bacterium]HBE06146.1 2-oxoglutarate ferredoxin oxidoreductase subunit beta [Bacillota bacterium]HBG43057.1 2-oxoglutarate ferredoxin oxidoreductase subunit beta [Bacillota bacterium]